MCVHLLFELKKTTQALNYFAVREGGKINRMKAVKLLFFADRYNLRNYGLPISKDDYKAMEHGPVPSNAKNITELNDEFLDKETYDYVTKFISAEDKYHYKSVADVDLDELSKKDMETLKLIYDKFGSLDKFAIRDLTHKYNEWKKWEEKLKRTKVLQMDYLDFLLEPEEGEDTLGELNDEDKEFLTNQLKEYSYLSNT